MPKLWELAKLIRSKNAGPFELTFDVMFDSRDNYDRVCKSNVINPEWVASTYRVPVSDVMVINYDVANSIKITIPRPVVSGNVDDTDVFGGQQYGPIVQLEVR